MLFVFTIVALGGVAFALWTWDDRRRALDASPAVSVVGAAIRYSDLGTIALPLPKSHDEIRELVERLHGSRAGKHRGEVGYVTSQGGFVKGQEALVIARQARQLRKVALKGDFLELDYLVMPAKAPPPPQQQQQSAPERWQRRSARRYRGPALWMTRTAAAGQIATREHLHREFLRTAVVVVPGLFVVGLIALQAGIGRLSGILLSAPAGGTMAAAAWLLPVGQFAVYALLGVALAMVLHARGAQLRRRAVAAFSALIAVHLSWAFSFSTGVDTYSTLFAVAMVVLAPLTFALFGRIRFKAGLLAVPSLVWTGLATYSTLYVYLGTS